MRLAQKDTSDALERAELRAQDALERTELRAQETKERAADRTHREELLQIKLAKATDEKANDRLLAEKLEN